MVENCAYIKIAIGGDLHCSCRNRLGLLGACGGIVEKEEGAGCIVKGGKLKNRGWE